MKRIFDFLGLPYSFKNKVKIKSMVKIKTHKMTKNINTKLVDEILERYNYKDFEYLSTKTDKAYFAKYLIKSESYFYKALNKIIN